VSETMRPPLRKELHETLSMIVLRFGFTLNVEALNLCIS
jgi:hypothetical protein